MKKSTVIKALLVVIACILMAYAPTMYSQYYVGPSRQGLTLHIKVVGEDGNPVPYAMVRVFMLTDKGPSLVGGAGTSVNGVATAHVFIPRYGAGFLWKVLPYIEDHRLVHRFVETREPSYAAVNLGIVAVTPDGMIGAKVLFLDPSFMKWPEDAVYVTVKLRKPPAGIEGHEGLPGSGVKSWWEYTPILKYGGGENVSMWYVLNFGVKVEVQSKYRVCGPGGCGDWEDAGSTQVTMDSGVSGGNVTGGTVKTLYLYLKYVDWTYCDPLTKACVNVIYAADTRMDPHKTAYSSTPWSGKLPDTPYCLVIPHDSTVGIVVNGGYHWDLSVSVNTSGKGADANITLGVTLSGKANPPLLLYVHAGHDGDADRYVKIVSPHGSGGRSSYVITYGDWT